MLLYLCGVVCVAMFIFLILMVKTDIIRKSTSAAKNLTRKAVDKMDPKHPEYLIISLGFFGFWIVFTIVSFILSPVLMYAFYVFMAILNIVATICGMIERDIEGNPYGDLPELVLPDVGIIEGWFYFWLLSTIGWVVINIILLAECADRIQNKNKKGPTTINMPVKEEPPKQEIVPKPQIILPPPKPKPVHVDYPKAPDASVKKYYCLDDGVTSKTWLTINEAKYYVNTLSFRKVFQLDGKNLVCRVYTKGNWVTHSKTKINCDDNGKLTFGKTMKIVQS